MGLGMWTCGIKWAEQDDDTWQGEAAEGVSHSYNSGAVSSGKCGGWTPKMSPSLDVNGFKLRNFDPKPRSDLVPRWKRPWISQEAGALAMAWPAEWCASDRLAEDGSASPKQADRGRRIAGLDLSRALRSPAGWSHGNSSLLNPKSPSVLVPPIITTACCSSAMVCAI